MSRAVLVLASPAIRRKAQDWIDKAPKDTRIEFRGPKRTIDQNARLCACLTDIATQRTHHGLKLSPGDWKILFMDALGRETRMVPNLDNNGFVPLGYRSSELSIQEMADMLELMNAFAAQKGVVFHWESE